jgi:hypothetical protein
MSKAAGFVKPKAGRLLNRYFINPSFLNSFISELVAKVSKA